jgi:hypothetical protein
VEVCLTASVSLLILSNTWDLVYSTIVGDRRSEMEFNDNGMK